MAPGGGLDEATELNTFEDDTNTEIHNDLNDFVNSLRQSGEPLRGGAPRTGAHPATAQRPSAAQRPAAQRPAPAEDTFDDDDHTEVNRELDVKAVRQMLGQARPHTGAHPAAAQRPAPAAAPPAAAAPSPNTFSAEEQTEIHAISRLGSQPATSARRTRAAASSPQEARSRFATTAQQSVRQRSTTGQPPAQAASPPPGSVSPQQPTPVRVEPRQAPQTERPMSMTSAQQAIHPGQARTSGSYASVHATGAQPRLDPSARRGEPTQPAMEPLHHPDARQRLERPASAPLEERTLPRTDTLAPDEATSIHATAAFASVRAASPRAQQERPLTGAMPHVSGGYPQVRPQENRDIDPLESNVATLHDQEPQPAAPNAAAYGFVDFNLDGRLVSDEARKQMNFLREETGVDFDPFAMSSPNLNALVLALGAQEFQEQERAAREAEVVPLSRKWGEPGSEPSQQMRAHYAAWGSLCGALCGMALLVLVSLVRGGPISELGAAALILPLLLALGAGAASGARPRQVEAMLWRARILNDLPS